MLFCLWLVGFVIEVYGYVDFVEVGDIEWDC